MLSKGNDSCATAAKPHLPPACGAGLDNATHLKRVVGPRVYTPCLLLLLLLLLPAVPVVELVRQQPPWGAVRGLRPRASQHAVPQLVHQHQALQPVLRTCTNKQQEYRTWAQISLRTGAGK